MVLNIIKRKEGVLADTEGDFPLDEAILAGKLIYPSQWVDLIGTGQSLTCGLSHTSRFKSLES